jgi:quercetin dioxygenase-like cupin family protein
MARDAVTAAPHVYKVALENDRVRVLAVTGRPGDKTEMHSHPAVVAIAMTDGKFKFHTPGGQMMEAELKAGECMFFDAVEHATEFVGTKEARAILVELK